MADHHRHQPRPSTRREVLGPGESRANIDSSTRRSTRPSKAPEVSSPASLPHNTSLTANGTLDVRTSSPTASSPRQTHLSSAAPESQRASKRYSEISNCTTGSGSGRKSYVGRWQLGKTIGQGGCSTVRLVRHRDTGQIGAAKIISRKMAETVRAQSLANLAEMPDKSLQDLVAAGKAMPPPPPGLLREIAIMKLLDHSNIVRLYDVWENHNELYLIMEYVEGGELFHYIEECRGLGEGESVYIFRQIVAALLYCHRMHIHHRDLKPENILLDRENIQVKLVDFGMAALQPEGKKLTTACGSPHYAAPEVIKSRPYDGARADVWSCGVILYVMLTGMTPFNYDQDRNLGVMYRAIAEADYYMPPELSRDAQDLLRKIFVPDPRRRITMEQIWEHPLLHKFDEEWGYTGPLASKEAWVGPSPILEDWTVTRESEVDKEILRNMRTLWHSVPQSVLVKKLVSNEPNQEKLFYAALLKHREDHLENYLGGADAISYSASDYQHNTNELKDQAPMPNQKQHSQSQYSIMNDEHLRTPQAGDENLPSDGSYDPYRSSRYQTTPNGTPYTKVTVHRRGEISSHKHKRKVSFSHHRKSSQTAVSTSARFTPELQAKARFSQLMHGSPTPDANSPSCRVDNAIRSRKEKSVTPAPRTRPRKNSTGALKTDIRKASSELEQACEEAFNRCSFSSSVFTTASVTEKAGYETPPSSVSKRDSASSIKEHAAPRPLPALPTDTPNTFITRTLEETRHKLAARSASEGNDGSAKIEQVLANLDRIMPGDKRAVSAPDHHVMDNRAPLPVISEEGRPEGSQGRPSTAHRYRSVTAPIPEKTVRMVQPSSPVSPASPYNWRSVEQPTSQNSQNTVVDRTRLTVPTADPRMVRKKSSDSDVPLSQISSQGSQEGTVKKKSSWFRKWKEPSVTTTDDSHLRPRSPMPWNESAGQSNKPSVLNRDNRPPHLDLTSAQVPAPKSSSSSEFPMRRESKGFSKWFGRKKDSEKCRLTILSPPSAATFTGPLSPFSTGPLSPLPPTTPTSAGGDNGTRSWFSRFLRLRPEVRTLAFNVPRTRARTELVRMLREWQRHGIKDLTYFPQDNAITASIDKVNSLGIKPVTFRIELFVVLKNGRKAGLSLARCSQMRGAASSFRKVIEVLEQVGRDRGLLVDDESQWNELCGILA
ncbi:Pkinase-domain-containing protein [Aureobasidium namibiae CBS 147.97]|uniref:non-specific serine/threonine protein kinase n=1 Tax=Aureobasidium namibiae CBS 147.97 TaxID=1043004 RepID=A0A074WKA2_9PEZI|nr:Pkinase-domain-containing protein [Aureobasidium namibiae CBS 147.97]KEQ73508.1 Pkinase-domain-containing protein [Aureobasidium namibiae CBS 147.97]